MRRYHAEHAEGATYEAHSLDVLCQAMLAHWGIVAEPSDLAADMAADPSSPGALVLDDEGEVLVAIFDMRRAA